LRHSVSFSKKRVHEPPGNHPLATDLRATVLYERSPF
jgi:hypothetical protein